MKRTLLTVAAMAAAIFAARAVLANPVQELNEKHHFPSKDKFFARVKSGGGQNLVNHGGPVIHSAHVVPIFWGPSWGTGGADNATATHIIQFFGQFGTNSHYATITQYYDGSGSIQTSNLGNTNWFDSSAPPTNVTDSAIQGEVLKYLSSHSFDASAIYEVFLPPSSYSSDGGSTSCGGPNLRTARITATSPTAAATSSTRRCPTRAAAAARSPAGRPRRTTSTSPATRRAKR